jgi:hypothetical protein
MHVNSKSYVENHEYRQHLMVRHIGAGGGSDNDSNRLVEPHDLSDWSSPELNSQTPSPNSRGPNGVHGRKKKGLRVKSSIGRYLNPNDESD